MGGAARTRRHVDELSELRTEITERRAGPQQLRNDHEPDAGEKQSSSASGTAPHSEDHSRQRTAASIRRPGGGSSACFLPKGRAA